MSDILSLYHLHAQFSELEKIFAENGGEITEQVEEVERAIEKMLFEKTDALGQFFQKMNDEIELADKHIERINEYKAMRKKTAEHLKRNVIGIMDRLGQKQSAGDLYQFSIRKPSKVVVINSENDIPAEFTTVKVAVDKTKLAKALKSGEEIPGAGLADGALGLIFKMKSARQVQQKPDEESNG